MGIGGYGRIQMLYCSLDTINGISTAYTGINADKLEKDNLLNNQRQFHSSTKTIDDAWSKSILIPLNNQPSPTPLNPIIQPLALQLPMQLSNKLTAFRPRLVILFALPVFHGGDVRDALTTRVFHVRGVGLHLCETAFAVFFEVLGFRAVAVSRA